MVTETVLTDEEIRAKKHALGVIAPDEFFNKIARAIEQAVLQSPEVQRLREDAERWQGFRRAAAGDDWEFLERVKTHIENAIDNADGTPTEDQIDGAIDAAMEKKPCQA